MIWAGIVGDNILGPFRIEKGLRLTAKSYCELLESNFIPWFENQPEEFRNDLMFQQDNAPCHSAKKTKDWLLTHGFDETRVMTWPAMSPDLNPIENLWSLLKCEIYKEGKQYSSCDDLWEAIKEASSQLSPSTIKSLTDSMNKRLVKVIKSKGGVI